MKPFTSWYSLITPEYRLYSQRVDDLQVAPFETREQNSSQRIFWHRVPVAGASPVRISLLDVCQSSLPLVRPVVSSSSFRRCLFSRHQSHRRRPHPRARCISSSEGTAAEAIFRGAPRSSSLALLPVALLPGRSHLPPQRVAPRRCFCAHCPANCSTRSEFKCTIANSAVRAGKSRKSALERGRLERTGERLTIKNPSPPCTAPSTLVSTLSTPQTFTAWAGRYERVVARLRKERKETLYVATKGRPPALPAHARWIQQGKPYPLR